MTPIYKTQNVQCEFSPADVGISAVSLKAAGPFVGNMVETAGFSDFLMTVAVTNVGTASTGAFAIGATIYGADGITALSPALSVVTAIASTASTVATVNFGKQLAIAKNGTIHAEAKHLTAARYMRFTLTNTTPSDAVTSSLCSVYLTATP
jgi:hypothetical protein